MRSPEYWAGIFDGEGYVGISKSRNARIRPNRSTTYRFALVVEVCNLHKPMIEELQNEFGGSLNRYSKNKRPIWSWRLFGRSSIIFLQTIRPFCLIKKEQIDVALEYLDKYKNDGLGRPWLQKKERDQKVVVKTEYAERLKYMKKEVCYY